VLFGIVLSLGFIKVSPTIAEGIIFFAFLILFEFLLVFTEPYLEQYTNGEPIYNLLANAVLALLIFPVHAILEKLLKKRIVQ
jgi:putative effector of murein hydrolase